LLKKVFLTVFLLLLFFEKHEIFLLYFNAFYQKKLYLKNFANNNPLNKKELAEIKFNRTKQKYL